MQRNFFSLLCAAPDIDEDEFYARLAADGKVTHAIYRPDILDQNGEFYRGKIVRSHFWNVSFAKTRICSIEFTNCCFEDCLFMGTIFVNCRFTNCRFVRSNFSRCEFSHCFVDPRDFLEALPDRRYANIGVYLFQELLRNSRQQVQPDFVDSAQLQFRRWQRYLTQQELQGETVRWVRFRRQVVIFMLWLFEVLSGSGTSLWRMSLSAGVILSSLIVANVTFADALGLTHASQKVAPNSEIAYLSLVATLGFGDLSPDTNLGRVVVGGEIALGFVIFALLTSMIFRRISA